MAKTMCTISFVLPVPLLRTHPLFLTRTFVVFYIHHRFGLAFRTANGLRLARLVESRSSFPACAFFADYIHHRFGLAFRTTNGSRLARLVVSGMRFPAPADRVLRFHIPKSPMCRTAFGFSIKKPIGSTSFTIQIFAQFRHFCCNGVRCPYL